MILQCKGIGLLPRLGTLNQRTIDILPVFVHMCVLVLPFLFPLQYIFMCNFLEIGAAVYRKAQQTWQRDRQFANFYIKCVISDYTRVPMNLQVHKF